MLKKIVFCASIFFLLPIHNGKTTAVNFLTDLSNLEEKDIQGPIVLPMPNPGDGDRYRHSFPQKIIPFNFESLITPPSLVTPLDYASVYFYPDLLKKTNISAYLALPKEFSLNSHTQYPLAIFLHSSSGLTAYEYQEARKFNDRGIAVCMIQYLKDGRGGCRKGYIYSQHEFNPFMPAIDAYKSLSVLRTANFLNTQDCGLIGFSIGGTAALRAVNTHFRKVFSPDERPFRLVQVFGASPYSQLVSEEEATDQGSLVIAYHGTEDSFCPVGAMENFAQYSNHTIQLVKLERAGHYCWAGRIALLAMSPASRNHFTPGVDRGNGLRRSFDYLGSLGSMQVQQRDENGQKDQITFMGQSDPSTLTHILPPLKELQNIQREVIQMVMEGEMNALEDYLKKTPLLPNGLTLSSEKKENDEGNKWLTHIQDSIEVLAIGNESPAMGRKLKLKTLSGEIKRSDSTLAPDPIFANYVSLKMLENFTYFCGHKWEDEHYKQAANLSGRGESHTEGRNIITVDPANENIAVIESKSPENMPITEIGSNNNNVRMPSNSTIAFNLSTENIAANESKSLENMLVNSTEEVNSETNIDPNNDTLPDFSKTKIKIDPKFKEGIITLNPGTNTFVLNKS